MWSGVLLLAALVLAWGTAYKVSLYRQARITRAPAKLCTHASDSAKSQADASLLPAPEPLLEIVLFSGTVLLLWRSLAYEPVRTPALFALAPPLRFASIPQIAFRPPPVSLKPLSV